MIKFLNIICNIFLFIVNIYLYIFDIIKNNKYKEILINISKIKDIYLFIIYAVTKFYNLDDTKLLYNNNFIFFIRGNSVIYFNLKSFKFVNIYLKYNGLTSSPVFIKFNSYNIDCHPYIFLESDNYIYILINSNNVRYIKKWALRGITTDDVIIDSINIEENKLKVKEIVKCSECFYGITFNDGESFILLIDPVNETYYCYNSKLTMDEFHQATIDNNEEIIYKF